VSRGADLCSEARAAGLLLSRNGDGIHIESPLGRPLPEDLRRRLTRDRVELLAWLDWCETADELLLACSQRIERLYPAGCPLDDAAWQAAEEALNCAHRSQDLDVLQRALSDYESVARDHFAAYEKERKA
jgi:hypothetical protein